MILDKNKGITGRLIRCYKDKTEHRLSQQDLATIKHHLKNKKIGAPTVKPPIAKGLRKCEFCLNYDPNIKEANPAVYECVNCFMMFCERCLRVHEKLPNFIDHKSQRLEEEANYILTEHDFCEKHRERLKFYCLTCDEPLCIVCANFTKHDKHKIIKMEDMITEMEKIRVKIQEQLTFLSIQVDKNLEYFKFIKSAVSKQKDLYLKKLRADFEIMFKMLEKRFSELYTKIETAIDSS